MPWTRTEKDPTPKLKSVLSEPLGQGETPETLKAAVKACRLKEHIKSWKTDFKRLTKTGLQP